MSTAGNGSLHSGVIPSPARLAPSTASWPADNPKRGITVPAKAGHHRWRLMAFPAYDPGTGDVIGALVIGISADSVYNTLRELTGVDLIVSTVIVVVLAVVGFAIVQTNLRPLVDIEETAGEIADGHLNPRVPERDPRTENRSLRRSLKVMPSHIQTALPHPEE